MYDGKSESENSLPSKKPTSHRTNNSELLAAYEQMNNAELEANNAEEHVRSLERDIREAKEKAERAHAKFNRSFRLTKEIELQEPSQWNHMHKKLVEYKGKHGHVMVPHGNKNDKELNQLGRWVANQRVFYNMHCKGKLGHIKPTRIEVLNDIGFVWNRNDHAWENQFRSMVDFRKIYSHNTVSSLTNPEEKKKYKSLEGWIENQQLNYRKYNHSQPANISDERIKKLNDVGFDWVNPSGIYGINYKNSTEVRTPCKKQYLPNFFPSEEEVEEYWNESYRKLVDYFKENGHCNVYQDKKKGPTASEHRLRGFVMQQRKEYSKSLMNQKNILTRERIEKLESIGFSWSSGNQGGRKRKHTNSKNTIVNTDQNQIQQLVTDTKKDIF